MDQWKLQFYAIFRQIIILSQDMHEIWHNGRGSWKMVNNQSSQSLVKWWRYSTQLKMQALNRYSSGPVWLTDVQPLSTYASTHALQLSHLDLWPLTFRSSAILNYMKKSYNHSIPRIFTQSARNVLHMNWGPIRTNREKEMILS